MESRLIGIREAKAHLSRLVAEAERGSHWIITDRGRPVARLGPVEEPSSVPDKVEQLFRRGWLGPAPNPGIKLPPPLRIKGDAQAELQRDRGE